MSVQMMDVANKKLSLEELGMTEEDFNKMPSLESNPKEADIDPGAVLKALTSIGYPVELMGDKKESLILSEKIQTIDDSTDRIIVGRGGHFIALRKTTTGKWAEINSFGQMARIEQTKFNSLKEYLEKKSAKEEYVSLIF